MQPWSRVLVLPEGIYIKTTLSSVGTKAPTQVEDDDFMLNTGFLEHHPPTSPSTNQKKVTHPEALTLNIAFKYFSLEVIREFWFSWVPSVFLAWPCNKTFSVPNSDVSGLFNLTVHWAHKLVFSNKKIPVAVSTTYDENWVSDKVFIRYSLVFVCSLF